MTITVRGSWYEDNGYYVVVLGGMPYTDYRIGSGPTPHDAWEDLQATCLPSTAEESAALAWASEAGWIDDPQSLDDADDSIGDHVREPLGKVDWEAGDTVRYVACLYGDDGSRPGDCRVLVGEDEAGVWWLDDGDDTESETSGPYDDRESAESAAQRLASEQNDADEGEDAEAMMARLREGIR